MNELPPTPKSVEQLEVQKKIDRHLENIRNRPGYSNGLIQQDIALAKCGIPGIVQPTKKILRPGMHDRVSENTFNVPIPLREPVQPFVEVPQPEYTRNERGELVRVDTDK